MAKSCNFCDCLHNQLIRDRMGLGVRDQQTRKKLLQDRNLTLQRCIDICKSAEMTSSQLKTMGGQAEEIHKVNFSKKKKDGGLREIDCRFCGPDTRKLRKNARHGAKYAKSARGRITLQRNAQRKGPLASLSML